jgi:hypothetical protein|tara:strand:+ start:129 stop:401 length:273 start_codon:yes stop_codon:yes gene_type:complete
LAIPANQIKFEKNITKIFYKKNIEMAWYNIQNDKLAAECGAAPDTGRCGFCGARDIKVYTRMKIYFSEFEIEDTDCCYPCYHKNSKKAHT